MLGSVQTPYVEEDTFKGILQYRNYLTETLIQNRFGLYLVAQMAMAPTDFLQGGNLNPEPCTYKSST